MIVLVAKSGNHSNRLLQNIHLEAFCLEHRLMFLNPTLNNIEKYYNCNTSLINKSFFYILKLLKKTRIKIPTLAFDVDYESKINRNRMLKTKILLVEGWYFRRHDLVTKHHDFFKRKYALKYKYYKDNWLYNKMMLIDSNKYLLIGIHIRRGDYKKFKGGIYYYEDKTYLKYMKDVKNLLSNSFKKKIKFIVFSNESHSFENSEMVLVSNNIWYIDHHLMSLCHYLIGPPSSFTLWASYMGKVPLYHIKNKDEKILLERFIWSDL